MSRLPVAVVGVGHLGKEHARILAGMDNVELVGVVDPHQTQVEQVAQRCNTRAYRRHEEIIEHIQAAVVAAPTCYHHAVAREFIRHGIHLLVEKPLASNFAQAKELVDLSHEENICLQVGHIERYNPAFEELTSRPLVPRYLIAERCSGFTGRSTDVGVVLDLMIHDLDLILSLVQSSVTRVEAFGVAVLGGHEDMAQARVHFANGCVADILASRVHPEAIRRMRVWGVEGYASVDLGKRTVNLMQPGDHLRQGRMDSRRLDPTTLSTIRTDLFNRHIQSHEVDCSQRYTADQLTRELQDFIHCVETGSSPRVDGLAGQQALELAGQILDGIRNHAWTGTTPGPMGPHQLPTPNGWLFTPAGKEAA